jgi:hypothetical protein
MRATIPTTQPEQAWSRVAAQSKCETFPTGARDFGVLASGRVFVVGTAKWAIRFLTTRGVNVEC